MSRRLSTTAMIESMKPSKPIRPERKTWARRAASAAAAAGAMSEREGMREGRGQGSGMQKIVLGTGNPHKLEEMRAIFAALGVGGVELVGVDQAAKGPVQEPQETGKSFEENAMIKAMCYA